MAITPEDLQFFGEAVAELLGVDIPTLKQAVTFIQTQQVQSALQPVREAWGDKFDENFAAAQEHFNTLSDEQKALYDNPDGLQYLFDKFVAPKMSAESEATDNVPGIATGSTTDATASPVATEGLTREKINSMTKQEYAANADAITAFYATASE